MLRIQRSIKPIRLSNLQNIEFIEKSKIENAIDELLSSSNDPYAASLPFIASAEMGDEKRYELTRTQMLSQLENMETHSDKLPQWMQNNSFKAWMWGRVLLAAASMDDTNTAIKAKTELQLLLEKDITSSDNFAFFTWAWGYRAAYNQEEYENSKRRMLDDAIKLNVKFKESLKHEALSDALWAWVMNLQAAACADDSDTYKWIKEQIKLITGTGSVAEALKNGLESNDYPAWAMAKVRCASIIAQDEDLYLDIEKFLLSAINNAQAKNAKAEYVLSVLDNQLAIHIEQGLHKATTPSLN